MPHTNKCWGIQTNKSFICEIKWSNFTWRMKMVGVVEKCANGVLETSLPARTAMRAAMTVRPQQLISVAIASWSISDFISYSVLNEYILSVYILYTKQPRNAPPVIWFPMPDGWMDGWIYVSNIKSYSQYNNTPFQNNRHSFCVFFFFFFK